MKRSGVALALALVFGGAVLGVTSTIDPIYQAKASTVARPILGDDDLLGVLRLRQRSAQVRTSTRAPFLPEPGSALDRIAVAAGVPLDDVELVDTDAQPLFSAFRERPRRLKVVVESPDPEQAARGANAFLEEYLDYRRRWYAREMGEVRRYLRAKLRRARTGRRNFPSGPPHPEEGVEAADIVLRLERGTLGGYRAASAPADPITPRKWRDALAAALIGGLLGWFGAAFWPPGRWRLPRDRRR